MLMKSFMRNKAAFNIVVKNNSIRSVPLALTTAPIRSFSLPRYHFDDKDYEPTVTEVSNHDSPFLINDI